MHFSNAERPVQMNLSRIGLQNVAAHIPLWGKGLRVPVAHPHPKIYQVTPLPPPMSPYSGVDFVQLVLVLATCKLELEQFSYLLENERT